MPMIKFPIAKYAAPKAPPMFRLKAAGNIAAPAKTGRTGGGGRKSSGYGVNLKLKK